jgi:hypothetical protein
MKRKIIKNLAGGLFALTIPCECAFASAPLSCDTISETDIVDLDLSELAEVPVFFIR